MEHGFNKQDIAEFLFSLQGDIEKYDVLKIWGWKKSGFYSILLKGTSAVKQYHSRKTVFLKFCLHQQLKFDNSLYIVHAKWFVLITEFPAGHHFEVWRSCVAVPSPHSFIAIVFINSSDWHYNAHTSQFKMVARRKFNNQSKSLGVNYITRIIKFELLIETQVEENFYLRLTLLNSRGSL